MPEVSPNAFGGANPVLRVESLSAAIDYYAGVLGFQIDWSYLPHIASVSRGQCHIFLCQGDQGHAGSWLWVGVEDAAALEAEFRSRGAKIRHPATNYNWALELQVEDLDGNVLRFGSDPIDGEPFGQWLDMYGRLWDSRQG